MIATMLAAALALAPTDAAAAQADLQFAAARIAADHPGMAPGADPALAAQARQAANAAQAQARRIVDGAGYARVMQAYVAAFGDPHVAIELSSGDAERSTQPATASAAQGAFERLTPTAWQLTLPTFYAGDPGFETTMAAIATATDALRQATPALLILDLRGNGGGAAAPGDAVLAAIWGEQALPALDRRRADASLWRVSDGVIDNLHTRRARIAARYPQELPGFDRLLDGLRAAQRAGTPLYRDPLPRAASGTPPRGGPARIVAITDGACISACLDFMDRLLEGPGVEQVGQPTGADTLYTEVESVPLPSGRATLLLPMQRLQGRQRGAMQAYAPRVRLDDDAAVSAWLRREVAAVSPPAADAP
ncbi:S41 family peptidase [Xanthomonas bundabergensis]|uniref:S41 family peptidase n=1 Tax=Xanthomonas bundabergensis TaxID=3160842 RepID=UPI003516412B